MGFKPHLAQLDTKWQFGLCKNQIQSLDDSTVDHIIPYSKGGKTVRENGQLAHRGCDAGRTLNCLLQQRLRRDVQPDRKAGCLWYGIFLPWRGDSVDGNLGPRV